MLNSKMIGAIKVATFRMWPLESTETDEIPWRKQLIQPDVNSHASYLNLMVRKTERKISSCFVDY